MTVSVSVSLQLAEEVVEFWSAEVTVKTLDARFLLSVFLRKIAVRSLQKSIFNIPRHNFRLFYLDWFPKRFWG